MPRELIGVVEAASPGFIRVGCPDAPAHLRILYLTPHEAGAAEPGDRVRLVYESSRARGLWRVAEVLP